MIKLEVFVYFSERDRCIKRVLTAPLFTKQLHLLLHYFFVGDANR